MILHVYGYLFYCFIFYVAINLFIKKKKKIFFLSFLTFTFHSFVALIYFSCIFFFSLSLQRLTTKNRW